MIDPLSCAVPKGETGWLEPKPLPNGLAPVETFSTEFMPEALGPWIDDISSRLQCPPDYVAVTAITALGAVVGRRVGIRPQIRTDWTEFSNQWGCFIGRPGMLKSPAMNEALKPIRHLEAEATKENEIAQQAYQVGMNAFKLRQDVKLALDKARLKGKKTNPVDFELGEKPKDPVLVRYRTNDISYQSLGEILISNPSGILIERDELISLLRHLDRED
jgi:hypothetical protein